MTPNPYPLTISAFPTGPVLSLTPGQLRDIIKDAVEEATRPLRDQIEELQAWRDREEVREEMPRPPKGEGAPPMEAIEARVEEIHVATLEEVARDRQRIARLEEVAACGGAPPKPGTKSAQRIARMEEILKSFGGSRSFKALRADLGLSPSQFSQLIRKIDKRRFIVAINPRARDEKALRLRAFT